MTERNDVVRVVVVGSGNVAEAIALAVSRSWGVELCQVVARNAERAAAIAQMARSEWTTDFDDVAEADFYVISVSDRAVAEVAERLHRPADSILVHTAGSVGVEALGEGRCGVLYPFQTFTSGREVDFGKVPLFVEGCNDEVEQQIKSFAEKLSMRVHSADSQSRREIHLAGVLACNFVNALYSMAADRLSQREGFSFDVLRPLIEETARKAIESEHPRNVQTGPAVRGDKAVAERHVAMLEGEPLKQQIYELLDEYIFTTSRKN